MMLNWDDYGKEENTITAVSNPAPVKVPEIKVEVEVPVILFLLPIERI